MLVEKTGVYRGRPIVTAVEEKDTGTVFFNGSFRCTEMRTAQGWEPVNGDQQITAYLNLITTQGKPNEINIRALKESLGWDGGSFSSLQREDWNGTECQLVVEDEEYEGKTRRKVKYINPRDYEGGGGVTKADTQVIQSLDAKYGSMLRAMAGGKANGVSPTAPASQAIGKDLAWGTFNRLVDAYGKDNPDKAYSAEDRTNVFKTIVREFANGQDPNKFGVSDWAQFNNRLTGGFSPATRGFIPF